MIKGFRITVLIPVYNEQESLPLLLKEVCMQKIDEVIIVDDSSTDNTQEVIRTFVRKASFPGILIKTAFHEKNQGKGAAIKTALAKASGDIMIVQDADLEYDPNEYELLIEPIAKNKADVVYGSRFKGTSRVFYFWHYVGNKFLTLVANVLFNSTLTDMETCYKVFKKECVTDLQLRSKGWGFDPEITAHFLKKKIRMVEVPISYYGRTYNEGKKIRWEHGFTVLFMLIRCRFFN